MPSPTVTTDSLSIAEIARQLADRKLPPVDQWNPAHCGQSHMAIDGDGRWWHEGSLIQRAELVRLFATLLRREADGSHVLVTPAEKLTIDVADVAFIATEVIMEGSGPDRTIAALLNTDEAVMIDAEHPLYLKIDSGSGEYRPYVHVRGGLEARVSRPAYYALAHAALDEGHEPAGLWSHGQFFSLDMPE